MLEAFTKYAEFTGRSRRQEYWMFVLLQIVCFIGSMIIDNLLGINIKGLPYGPIYGICALVFIIPGLAVTVRRLHDTGKSGWMYFVGLIPIIGGIWVIILMATEGDYGDNEYGPDPKSTLE